MTERGWFAAFYEDLLFGVSKACSSRCEEGGAVPSAPAPAQEDVPDSPTVGPCDAQPGVSMSEDHRLGADRQETLGEYQPAAPRSAAAAPPLGVGNVASVSADVGRERPSGHSSVLIPASSIGYQLLHMAGWREGRGLGVAEQGISSPLPAWHNHGRRGVGAPSRAELASAAAPAAACESVQRSKAQRSQEQVSAGAAAGTMAGGGRPPGGPGRPRRAPKRGWECVAVEEPLPHKVARVKQVIQAEADEAADKALARAVYRAFSDINGAAAPDSNPLLRRNKLSASNPLL